MLTSRWINLREITEWSTWEISFIFYFKKNWHELIVILENNMNEDNKSDQSVHSNYPHFTSSIDCRYVSPSVSVPYFHRLTLKHSEDGQVDGQSVHQARHSRQRWSSNSCVIDLKLWGRWQLVNLWDQIWDGQQGHSTVCPLKCVIRRCLREADIMKNILRSSPPGLVLFLSCMITLLRLVGWCHVLNILHITYIGVHRGQ